MEQVQRNEETGGGEGIPGKGPVGKSKGVMIEGERCEDRTGQEKIGQERRYRWMDAQKVGPGAKIQGQEPPPGLDPDSGRCRQWKVHSLSSAAAPSGFHLQGLKTSSHSAYRRSLACNPTCPYCTDVDWYQEPQVVLVSTDSPSSSSSSSSSSSKHDRQLLTDNHRRDVLRIAHAKKRMRSVSRAAGLRNAPLILGSLSADAPSERCFESLGSNGSLVHGQATR
jgi:hypothetical protein